MINYNFGAIMKFLLPKLLTKKTCILLMLLACSQVFSNTIQNGLVLTVAGDDVVTVASIGPVDFSLFQDGVSLGNVGVYTLINGWSIGSVSRTYFANGSELIKMDLNGVEIYTSDIPVNSFSALTIIPSQGALFQGDTTLGAALRANYGEGTNPFISIVALNPGSSIDYTVEGTITVLPPETDLSITKTDGVTTAIPGNSVTYTIVASNDGPLDDPTVTVTDTFPADLTCTYTSVEADGATGNTAAGSGVLAETLNMPSGSSVTYTATCDIDSAATGTLSNTATIAGTIPDSITENNTATDSDTVLTPEADLSIVMTPPPANITTPDTFTYIVDVTNTGPSDATNVFVTDLLSVGYSGVETVGCVEDPTGYPYCTLGNLAPGESASYSLSFSLGSVDGGITNTATVASDAIDGTVANNTGTSVIFGMVRIIPTINQWGLYIIMLLIGLIAFRSMPRVKSN